LEGPDGAGDVPVTAFVLKLLPCFDLLLSRFLFLFFFFFFGAAAMLSSESLLAL
jgi:hypothetical protein